MCISKQYPTQDELKELFTYDDGKLIWKIDAAQSVKAGSVAGSLRKNGYYQIKINGKNYYLHRLIFIYHNGVIPQGFVCDHKSGVKSDNRIGNLQAISNQQNIHKQKLERSNNSSGYRGVCWRKDKSKWQSYITINNRLLHLGYYDNLTDAAMAYDIAAIKYHGEFARTNFPIDNYSMKIATE